MINKTKNSHLTLFIILSLMIMGQISLDIYLPAMPKMTSLFNTSAMLMQLSITCMLATFSLCQLIIGALVKHYGKRKLVTLALLTLTIANFLCAFSHSITVFLLLRLLTGIGSGCCNVLARTELIDSYSGNQFKKYSSYLYLSWALVPMLAPLAGGYISQYAGWQYIFLFLSLISISMFIFIYFLYPQQPFSPEKVDFKETVKHYRTLIEGHNKNFMHLILCIVLSFSTMITIVQCLPFYLVTAHNYNNVQIGNTLFTIGLATIIGVFINIKLLKKLQTHKVIYIGLAFMSISSIIMLRYQSHWSILIDVYMLVGWFSLIRIGAALVLPNCQAAALSIRRDLSSYASALLGFLTYIGSVIISFSISHLPHQSAWPLLATLMVESIMCLMIYLLRPHNHV